MKAMVVGFLDANDEEGLRVPCETPEIAGATIASLLRQGFSWIHIDNLEVLNNTPQEATGASLTACEH